MDTPNIILIALEIMGKGMAGIFIATLLVIAVVWVLAKVTTKTATSGQNGDQTSASS